MEGRERSRPFPFLEGMDDKRARIEEQLKDENPDALFADGFDDAIIGIARRFGGMALVAYDRDLCVKVLMDRDGMSQEEANEFFDFNVIGSWVGEGTPIFLDTEV
jgi:hypothetical protein